MPVGAITLYGTSGVGVAYSAPVRRLYQPPVTTPSAAQKAYEVTLTTEAKAKAMKLQGYSVSMISIKLGLDIKTIYRYLGITETANDTALKTAYSPTKTASADSEATNTIVLPSPIESTSKSTSPKAPYSEPPLLTQGRANLATELTKLATAHYTASQLISSVRKETLVSALSQVLSEDDGLAARLFQPPSSVS